MGWKLAKIVDPPDPSEERYLLMVYREEVKPEVKPYQYGSDNFIPVSQMMKCIRISESRLANLVDVIDPGWRNRKE